MKEQTYKEINQEAFKAFVQLPMDTPVVMLNLLKFKDAVPETGLSGAESYNIYMQEVAPFFAKASAEVLFMGKPLATLIGPEDEGPWDKMLLVKYNTIADFLGMVQAEGYPAQLRVQALEDSRLIPCE